MFSTPVWNKRESLGPLAPQARLVAMLRSLVSAIKHMDNVAVGTEKFI